MSKEAGDLYFSREERNRTEEEIRAYFRRKRELGLLNYRLEALYEQQKKIMKNMDESNIRLEVSMPSMNYSADRVQVSFAGSPQERAVESAYERMERDLDRTDARIRETEERICELECQNIDMDYILRNLDEKYRSFVCWRYEKRKGIEWLAEELYISRSAVYLLREEVLDDIALICQYTEELDGSRVTI